MTDTEYYTVQFRKALARIRNEINYCCILLPFVDVKTAQDDLKECDRQLFQLDKDVSHRLAELDRPKSCINPQAPDMVGCKTCPNLDIHLDGGLYCKLSLRAVSQGFD